MNKSSYFIFFIIVAYIASFFTLNGQKNTEAPYQAGEFVRYEVSYGFITAGEAILKVDTRVIDNIEYDHVVMKGVTKGLADKIYKVKDIYESFMHKENSLTHLAIRNVSEGRYKRYNEVLYYRDSMPDSTILHSQASGRVIASKNIKDILSSFYYARRYLFNEDTLKEGKLLTLTSYFTDEVYPLYIRYLGTEVIKTDIGKIECYKFSPVTEVGRLFKTEDDMRIWISTDKNKLPVRIQFDIFIGSVFCDLVEYSGLKYSFSH